jgi:hypothetical protein
MRQLARSLTGEAFETIAELMREGPPKVRLEAAGAVLDRAWGKTETEGKPCSYRASVIFSEEDLADLPKISPCTNDDCRDGKEPRFWTAEPLDGGGWKVSCHCGTGCVEMPPRENLNLEAAFRETH